MEDRQGTGVEQVVLNGQAMLRVTDRYCHHVRRYASVEALAQVVDVPSMVEVACESFGEACAMTAHRDDLALAAVDMVQHTLNGDDRAALGVLAQLEPADRDRMVSELAAIAALAVEEHSAAVAGTSLSLVVGLPDGSPGTIRADATDVFATDRAVPTCLVEDVLVRGGPRRAPW
jgi:hypothetical protein